MNLSGHWFKLICDVLLYRNIRKHRNGKISWKFLRAWVSRRKGYCFSTETRVSILCYAPGKSRGAERIRKGGKNKNRHLCFAELNESEKLMKHR